MTISVAPVLTPVTDPVRTLRRLPEAVTGPLVVAHRGACGYRPEHTLEAYRLGLDLGADALEVDLVPTRDGVLVAHHDLTLDRTTDVARHPDLARRRSTRVVDGVPVTGWFVDDLTLEEVRRLTVRERMPRVRPRSAVHDGRHRVPTFAEVLALASRETRRRGRRVRVLAELKHPGGFRARGLAPEDLVLDEVHRHGRTEEEPVPMHVLSFDTGALRRLARCTRLPMVALVDRVGPGGLPDDLDTYAQGVGLRKGLLSREATGPRLVQEAHRRGLEVHAWTLRAENRFLSPGFRDPARPSGLGNLVGEARRLMEVGVDGLITDHPDEVAGAVG